MSAGRFHVDLLPSSVRKHRRKAPGLSLHDYYSILDVIFSRRLRFAYCHSIDFAEPLNSITTPQYGHSGVGGIGGNDNLLFTRTDFARGTSVVDLA